MPLGLVDNIFKEKGVNSAQKWQVRQYEQARKDLEPWREAGAEAIEELRGIIRQGPGDVQDMPGYQFQVDEGMKALAQARAASGDIGSDGYLKEAMRYGQNLASTNYQTFLNNWLNTTVNPRLAISNSGQVSAGNMAQQAMNHGNAMADLSAQKGNIRASMFASPVQNALNLATYGAGAGWFGGGGAAGGALQSGTYGPSFSYTGGMPIY